ncbi:hypothetical protein A5695_03855 [Mycobacterium sp. E1747]|nr:hypothetical protein A5695_03855 [Mycobacterium sp. E1747]
MASTGHTGQHAAGVHAFVGMNIERPAAFVDTVDGALIYTSAVQHVDARVPKEIRHAVEFTQFNL